MEEKRVYDNFRKTIAQHWKGAAITTSETNLSWDSIYKPGGTAISANNKLRSRKIKSGKDSHGFRRRSCLTLQGREGRMVTLISVYKVCKGPIDPTKTMTALTQQWTILNSESDFFTHLILFINDIV